MVETGDVELSPGAIVYITKKLKLPKKYFDTGLFRKEKERLDYLKEAYPREAGSWEKDEKRMFAFEKEVSKVVGFDPQELAELIENDQ